MTTLSYHKELYSIDAIKGSAELFRDFANIDVLDENEYVRLVVKPHEVESQAELIGELNNQILGQSIELHSKMKEVEP